MNWQKLGLVYCAGGEQPWAQSHAFIPTSMMLDDERIRVYAAFLDNEKTGRVGYVDVDARNPLRILKVSKEPVLDIGAPGTFDEGGVSPTCLIEHKGKLYLYYIGWQLGVKVPYLLFVGLAVSNDGGASFERNARVPCLDRSDQEFLLRSAASVLRDDGRWRMWYVAGNQWIENAGKQLPRYNIRHLESADGVHWGEQGAVCLDLANKDEFGLARPFVLKERELFKMWYSIRTMSKGYRLGYAESDDGRHWKRKDAEVGVDVSESGWDSEMICFSCIQKTRSGTYMFYNGNNYGETGFGVARLKS